MHAVVGFSGRLMSPQRALADEGVVRPQPEGAADPRPDLGRRVRRNPLPEKPPRRFGGRRVLRRGYESHTRTRTGVHKDASRNRRGCPVARWPLPGRERLGDTRRSRPAPEAAGYREYPPSMHGRNAHIERDAAGRFGQWKKSLLDGDDPRLEGPGRASALNQRSTSAAQTASTWPQATTSPSHWRDGRGDQADPGGTVTDILVRG